MIVRTPNGKFVKYSTCAGCRSTKTKFVRNTTGGKLDIHKAIKPIVPKGGITLPGTNYCGPYNRMDLSKEGTVCRSHDLCYGAQHNKQKCDKKMISDLRQVQPSPVVEAVNKKIVQGVIGVKSKLGLGVKHAQQRSVKKVTQKEEKLRSMPLAGVKWTDKLAEELHKQVSSQTCRSITSR